ncbi:MAG: peptide deformylase [Candidatus Margulisbacteria bacterium]|jgi:peptide deformylase|nr:peptide deformylase [Candidatus Margulisiibacteriota bacterium]
MLLPVIQQPDPRLREISAPVEKITPELKKLAADMLETMYALGNGIGLAAPQVGRLCRMFVCDVSESRDQPRILINPVLASHNQEKTKRAEGCLSCRGFEGLVERYAKVTVRALALDGKKMTVKADGLLARCLQHELDHLDGIIIMDKAEPAPPDRQDDAKKII